MSDNPLNLAQYTTAQLNVILGQVSAIERKILILRFGLDVGGKPRTLETVGGMLNMTRGEVRRNEARALSVISHHIASEGTTNE